MRWFECDRSQNASCWGIRDELEKAHLALVLDRIESHRCKQSESKNLPSISDAHNGRSRLFDGPARIHNWFRSLTRLTTDFERSAGSVR
jgi:hypothetical protein